LQAIAIVAPKEYNISYSGMTHMKIVKKIKLFRKRPKFPKKKVLILEGGGMRGIFLVGVLQAFSERGYFPWKSVIGSSAGALTGAAYLTGQIYLARDAYFTKLLSGKFIHFANVFKQDRHILDLDWMIDTIVKSKEGLDIEKLRRACTLLITATAVQENAPPETIFLNSKKDDPLIALKATAALPFLYRGFVHYKEHIFLDGGLLAPFPYQKALSAGFREKDILVLLTRPKGYRKKEESFWIRTLYESYYKDPKYKHLVACLLNRHKLYNQILNDLETKHKGIDVIYPPEEFDVQRLTRDEKKILTGFEQGISAAVSYLYPVSSPVNWE
jgi:predicted patatin/cPLA2 family phospholipase